MRRRTVENEPVCYKVDGRAFITFPRAVYATGPGANSGSRTYVADVYEARVETGAKPVLVRVVSGKPAPSPDTARHYASEALRKILGQD